MKPSPFHFLRELVLLALRQGSYPLACLRRDQGLRVENRWILRFQGLILETTKYPR